jgi:hypothetical protein
MYLKITLQNYCPEVPKVVPMGAQVDPQRHPGAIKVLSKIAAKRDAEKRPVSDASKHSKSPKCIVFWQVAHAIRTRLCSPNTLFTFLVFRPKQPPNDIKKLPQMYTNAAKRHPKVTPNLQKGYLETCSKSH